MNRRMEGPPREAMAGRFRPAPASKRICELKAGLATIVGEDRAAEIVRAYQKKRACTVENALARLDRLSSLRLDGRAASLPWSNFLLESGRFEGFVEKARAIDASIDVAGEIDKIHNGELSGRLIRMNPDTRTLLKVPGRLAALKKEFGDDAHKIAEKEPEALIYPAESYRAWLASHRAAASAGAYRKLNAVLYEKFGPDDAGAMLAAGNLSPLTKLRRVESLRVEHPEHWEGLLRERKTALCCSERDFRQMVVAYCCGKAEEGFRAQLRTELEALYTPQGAERLLRIMEKSRLNAETVLGRIEDVADLCGVQLPARKAWLLVTNHHAYSGWIRRMRTYAPSLRTIMDNCPDKEVAVRAVQGILASDRRCHANNLLILSRTREALALGPAALRDVALQTRKAILNYNDRAWHAHMHEGARISARCVYERMAHAYRFKPDSQLQIDRGERFIVFSDYGLGVPATMLGGEPQVKRADVPLLRLYMQLNFIARQDVAPAAAGKAIRRIAAKKHWDTRDEVALFIIREYAADGPLMKHRIWERFSKACKALPAHRHYRPGAT